MGTPYSMNGLYGVWSEALRRNEPTVVFEIAHGAGQFLFAMFFDPEDERTRDQLLLFLKNTHHMLRLKLYGAHRRGEFRMYLEAWQVDRIRRELQLADSEAATFDIGSFLGQINARIPRSMSLAARIAVLRENRLAFRDQLAEILDFFERTELIGEVHLPPGKRPRERTLRKLYLYSQRSPAEVATYIDDLRRRNCTLSWRVPDTDAGVTDATVSMSTGDMPG